MTGFNFLCIRFADFPCIGNAGIDFHTSRKHSTSPSSSDTHWQRRSLTCNFLSSPQHRASHYLLVSIIVISFLFITCLNTHFEGQQGNLSALQPLQSPAESGSPSLKAERQRMIHLEISSLPGFRELNSKSSQQHRRMLTVGNQSGIQSILNHCRKDGFVHKYCQGRVPFWEKETRLKSLQLLHMEIKFRQNNLNM